MLEVAHNAVAALPSLTHSLLGFLLSSSEGRHMDLPCVRYVKARAMIIEPDTSNGNMTCDGEVCCCSASLACCLLLTSPPPCFPCNSPCR